MDLISLRNLVLLGLQNPDGSFSGDRFGETDTRFLYCAVSALSLLGRLGDLDVEKTVAHVVRCRNFDGGFGTVPGAESHAGQSEYISRVAQPLEMPKCSPASTFAILTVWVCTAALAILGRLNEEVDQETLGWWLAERQLPNGGLNGRPEKLEDVSDSVPQSSLRDQRLIVASVPGVLRPLGPIVLVDTSETPLDRRRGSDAVHTLGTGTPYVLQALERPFGGTRR